MSKLRYFKHELEMDQDLAEGFLKNRSIKKAKVKVSLGQLGFVFE